MATAARLTAIAAAALVAVSAGSASARSAGIGFTFLPRHVIQGTDEPGFGKAKVLHHYFGTDKIAFRSEVSKSKAYSAGSRPASFASEATSRPTTA